MSLIKIKNKLADHVNYRLINEKMDIAEENNAVLFEILQDINDMLADDQECTDYGVL